MMSRRDVRTCLLAFFLCIAATSNLAANATLLVGEPYGSSGGLNPTGHAAVYLDRVCAASPTKLRLCAAGEQGIVISRYHRIADVDWAAIPLFPYLYGVESAAEVPATADTATVAHLRDAYRRRHLAEFVPDAAGGTTPGGNWTQLVGAAYDRKMFAFEIETSEAQDEEFIRRFNSRQNQSHFNLLYRNCADFARDVINTYYPKAVRRNVVADLGITTPKAVAAALVRYSEKHPELAFSAFIIPQIPGSRPPSKKLRGVLEALVKSKKYALPLVVTNVWVTAAFAVGYLTTGRFNPQKITTAIYGPAGLEARAFMASEAARVEERVQEASDTQRPPEARIMEHVLEPETSPRPACRFVRPHLQQGATSPCGILRPDLHYF